jgi:hypothetical protein
MGFLSLNFWGLIMISVGDKKEKPSIKIERSHIIIVEGKTELYVIEQILQAQGLGDALQVIESGGRSSFDIVLKATAESEICTHILLFADNDDDIQGRFKDVQEQFKKASLNDKEAYTIPSAPFTKTAQTIRNIIYSDVFMVPSCDKKGTVERICWEAFKFHYSDLIPCVEDLALCAKVDEKFPEHNRYVMRVEALLSILFGNNPKRSLGDFAKGDKNPKPPPNFFTHPTFDTIRDYLISFSKV